MSDKAAGSIELPAFRLLTLEQSEFERFLHDDLGQCLVAIRSMAAAIDDESNNEIAQMMSQAADDAYVEVYDRMMELRAESLANAAEFGIAIRQCLDDARLESCELTPRLTLQGDIEGITDPVCRRLLLRCLRCAIGVLKRDANSPGELVIEIENNGDELSMTLQQLPGGLPENFCEHARIKRLENRLNQFGARLQLQRTRAGNAMLACLPCRHPEVA